MAGTLKQVTEETDDQAVDKHDKDSSVTLLV
jgi:hypothetical protein